MGDQLCRTYNLYLLEHPYHKEYYMDGKSNTPHMNLNMYHLTGIIIPK